MEPILSEFDLTVRYEVYRFFAEQGRVPEAADLAASLQAEPESVRAAYHKLHARHMLFLQPGSDSIRIANPFSAIPTRYRVRAGERAWWANCGWDALGIPAALGIEAQIEASYPDTDEPFTLRIENEGVIAQGQVVYFPLPCRQWYDDLIFT